MIIGLTIILVTLLYLFLVTIAYFSKPRIENFENKIYNYLIKISIINLFLEIGCCYFVAHRNTYLLFNEIICRVFLFGLLAWLVLFTFYMVYISFCKGTDYYEKHKKNCKLACFLIYIILSLISLLNPLYYFSDNTYTYSYGPAANTVVVMGIISIVIDIICLIKNSKNIKRKENYPLFVLILVMIFVAALRTINPGIIVINSSFALITIIMYFTIENPDVQIIGELNKNKKILEKNNEEKSNFLFRMTQEVRKPISNIENLADMIDIEKEYVKLEDVVNAIKTNTRQISYVVNNVLDVSDIDIRKIKITNTTYDAKRLFEEINLFIKDKIKLNVVYNSSISNELPRYLYGDYIKLKQAIMSILMDSAENTKKGFIDLNVNVLIKYDMCRLIITIEDSGKGMNIQQINDILTLDKTLDENDYKRLNEMNVDLNITKKIINIIGGSIMIKSEIDKGTEFIVVIDQKIQDDNSNKIVYEKNNYNKKVLIADDNLDFLKLEKKLLKDEYIDVVTTMYGQDVINKISVGEDFDYIILNDNMEKMSAYETFENLKKIKGFNTKVAVMITPDKEKIKNHYIDDGFDMCILKDDLEKEILKVKDKLK